MIIWVNSFLDLRPRKYNPVGVELTYLCTIIGIGLVLWLALQALPARARFPVLRAAGIVVAVVAVPISILYAFAVEYARTVWIDSPPINNNIVWLALETTLALAGLILYLWRRWPLPLGATTLLFVGHFSLWGWVFSSLFPPWAWGLALSAVPACSALAWTSLISKEVPTGASRGETVSGSAPG